MTEPLQALKQDPIDFILNDSPKCPHCGHECDINELEWFDLCDEGEHEKECPSCGREFAISSIASFRFSTDEQDEQD